MRYPFPIVFAVVCLANVALGQAPSRSATRLTLADAVERARRAHPMIVAAKQRIVMREAERLEAGLRPNPTLMISGENFPLDPPQGGFSWSRTMDWFATWSQTFETGGKRGLRVDQSEKNLEAARAEADLVERQVVYEVKAAYRHVFIARERDHLLRSSLANLAELVTLNQTRVKAGYTAEGDLIKSRLEAQRFEMLLNKVMVEYERAKIELLRAMGGETFDLNETSFELATPLEQEALVLNPVSLTQATLRQPAVRRAEARVESARTALELERARAKPDVLVTAGYKRNGVDNTLYGAVSVPLPVHSKNKGQIAAAAAELEVAESELRYTRSRLLAELAAARRAVELHQTQLESMRRTFLRDADESQQVSLAAYREGAVDLLVLLDAQRSRAQVQEMWLEALYEYQLAVHELERVAAIERLPGQVSLSRPTMEKPDER